MSNSDKVIQYRQLSVPANKTKRKLIAFILKLFYLGKGVLNLSSSRNVIFQIFRLLRSQKKAESFLVLL